MYADDPDYKKINAFLQRIPRDTLAYASFNCGAYTRALMHYEQFIKSHKDDLQVETELLDPLQVSRQTKCRVNKYKFFSKSMK